MLFLQKPYIRNNVNTLVNQNKELTRNAVLMNTVVSAEVTANHLTQLIDAIKSHSKELSINQMLVLGAEFEMISDYVKSIMRELDP